MTNRDPLEAARKAPKTVKNLCLNPGALSHSGIEYEPTKAFPREVLACTNLESLDLFRGIEYGKNKIPSEIGKLEKLRSLTLGGLSMKTLPESIGNLKRLRELSLDYADSLVELPKAIGKLSSLEELSLTYCEKLRTLPPQLGSLKKLKKLHASDTALKSVPKELWNATSLETLSLPEGVTSLPPGISKLENLKELFVSAKALVSIADELPMLSALTTLSLHQGERATLPESVGVLPRLRMLHVAFAGLTTLPASLMSHRTLADLDVAGNKLKTLEALVASLPKLKELDFSDNALDRGEKRRIDAMMKLPPGKRRTNAPKVKTPKVKTPKPTELGRVAAVNASLHMILGDVSTLKHWNGANEGGQDWERLCKLTLRKEGGPLDVGGEKAFALSLGVGQGVANVYRVGETIIVVEGFLEDWRDAAFLEDVAHPTDPKAKKVGCFNLERSKLVLMSGTDLMSDGEALIVKAKPGTYEVLLEKERNASWGSARRAVIREVCY